MVDGKYYDAGAYKAAPVPMALWSETVYEGVLTGVTQGLFTVTGALQRKDANEAVEWMAEGTWQSASSLKAKAAIKKPRVSVPRGMNDDDGPPVLRRAGSEKPKPPETPTTPSPTSPASSTGTTPAAPPPAAPPTAASSPAGPSQQEQAQADKPPEDSDRPVLKRGQPGAASAAEAQKKAVPAPPATTTDQAPTVSSTSVSTSASSSGTQSGAAPASQVQLIPGISDANGPDLLAYAYNMKPEEEQDFRKRMLAIAADEVRAHAGQPASGSPGAAAAHTSAQRGKAAAGKFAQPDFEDVQLRVFDLSNTNEPELVLTAKARMPQRSHEKQSSPDVQYMITLVAREDVNGDFHKALVSITDTQHLDAIPRLELIDAVDVDGDGRGELLFRQVSEAASAFVVYSVIGDRLYPLFQGTPG
jgi:hypothetical protein